MILLVTTPVPTNWTWAISVPISVTTALDNSPLQPISLSTDEFTSAFGRMVVAFVNAVSHNSVMSNNTSASIPEKSHTGQELCLSSAPIYDLTVEFSHNHTNSPYPFIVLHVVIPSKNVFLSRMG
ncbi:unnamed protein product [Protopolystoma xenopodis]|uniref:Uncharacterized protein n=1 Tax=Protopolystoma xenopodis TaxID=117903 RepID=A0A3S5A2F2_9PLAT|nr:unnamed protein product [Protopolystoma xenopodis]